MPPAPHSQARGSSSSFTKHIDNIQDVNEITSFVDSLIFRIDGNYYDLTTFSDDHPGGKEILVWAKRKAWDHTQMFAIHHVNYTKAASMMKRYLITNESVIYRIQQLEAMEVPKRFPRQLPHHTSPYYPKLLAGSGIKADYKPVLPAIDANGELIEKPKWSMVDLQMADCTFELPQKGSFYWELRQEVFKYFKMKEISYLPTTFYMQLFWTVAVLAIVSQALQFYFRSYLLAFFTGLTYLVLGGYGHQFIHNPVYFRKHAYLCLDWIGLWSYTYMLDHIAIHHIYTNTIPDNHFEGTDPFLLVNPLAQRAYWRKLVNWPLATIAVSVGVWGNYIDNVVRLIKGTEPFHWSIFLFPANYVLTCLLVQDVWLGLGLAATSTVTVSFWYFTIALMNHNQEENWNMEKLTAAAQSAKNNGGWAEMQLVTSSDIGYNYGFLGSMICLWLNYHTVHHLLPTVDMSHHAEAQKILTRVSTKHGIGYSYKSFWTMYWDMLETFSVARAFDAMMERG